MAISTEQLLAEANIFEAEQNAEKNEAFAKKFIRYIEQFKDTKAILKDIEAASIDVNHIEILLRKFNSAVFSKLISANKKTSFQKNFSEIKATFKNFQASQRLEPVIRAIFSNSNNSPTLDRFCTQALNLINQTHSLPSCYKKNFLANFSELIKEFQPILKESREEKELLDTLLKDIEKSTNFTESVEQAKSLTFFQLKKKYGDISLGEIKEYFDLINKNGQRSNKTLLNIFLDKITLYIEKFYTSGALKGTINADKIIPAVIKEIKDSGIFTLREAKEIIALCHEIKALGLDNGQAVRSYHLTTFESCLLHFQDYTLEKNLLSELKALNTNNIFTDLIENFTNYFNRKSNLIIDKDIEYNLEKSTQEIEETLTDELHKQTTLSYKQKLEKKNILLWLIQDIKNKNFNLPTGEEYIEIAKLPSNLDVNRLAHTLRLLDPNNPEQVKLFVRAFFKITTEKVAQLTAHDQDIDSANIFNDLFNALDRLPNNVASNLHKLESIQQQLNDGSLFDCDTTDYQKLIDTLIETAKPILSLKDRKKALQDTMDNYIELAAADQPLTQKFITLKNSLYLPTNNSNDNVDNIENELQKLVMEFYKKLTKSEKTTNLKMGILAITNTVLKEQQIANRPALNLNLAHDLRTHINELAQSYESSRLPIPNQDITLLNLRILFCVNYYRHLCQDQNNKSLLSNLEEFLRTKLTLSDTEDIDTALTTKLQDACEIYKGKNPDFYKSVILADEMQRIAQHYLKLNPISHTNQDFAKAMLQTVKRVIPNAMDVTEKNAKISYQDLVATCQAQNKILVRKNSKNLIHSLHTALKPHMKMMGIQANEAQEKFKQPAQISENLSANQRKHTTSKPHSTQKEFMRDTVEKITHLQKKLHRITNDYLLKRKRFFFLPPANKTLADNLIISINTLAMPNQDTELSHLRMLFCLNHYRHLCQDKHSTHLLPALERLLRGELQIGHSANIDDALTNTLDAAPSFYKSVVLADEIQRLVMDYLKHHPKSDNIGIAKAMLKTTKKVIPNPKEIAEENAISYRDFFAKCTEYRRQLASGQDKVLLNSLNAVLKPHIDLIVAKDILEQTNDLPGKNFKY